MLECMSGLDLSLTPSFLTHRKNLSPAHTCRFIANCLRGALLSRRSCELVASCNMIRCCIAVCCCNSCSFTMPGRCGCTQPASGKRKSSNTSIPNAVQKGTSSTSSPSSSMARRTYSPLAKRSHSVRVGSSRSCTAGTPLESAAWLANSRVGHAHKIGKLQVAPARIQQAGVASSTSVLTCEA